MDGWPRPSALMSIKAKLLINIEYYITVCGFVPNTSVLSSWTLFGS
jgi:hypothetical protein